MCVCVCVYVCVCVCVCVYIYTHIYIYITFTLVVSVLGLIIYLSSKRDFYEIQCLCLIYSSQNPDVLYGSNNYNCLDTKQILLD